MLSLYIKGIGMMVGMIMGAGIFALPYAFSRAGLFWGLLLFLFSFLILIFLHFMYGEIAYYTRGKHRFTGYVEIFLGKGAKQLSFITTMGSYYGTLLIYGLLGGIFISNIFPNLKEYNSIILFFVIAGILSLMNLSKIADINFYLTIPLFGFIIYLFYISIPFIRVENFFGNLNFSFTNSWFLPYGIWFFSLSGFAAIPETRDIFSKTTIKSFKKVILLSLILSAFFCFLFIISVWGVGNNSTTEDALSGIVKILGERAFLIGSLIGLLAVFTSYLTLAIDMRGIFRYDYKISRSLAWFLTVSFPVVLFLLGANDFSRILSIIGALGLGILGVFIILMAKRLRTKIKEGDPDDILKPDNGDYMKPRRFIQAIVLIGILAGVFYELWRIFS